MFKRNAIPRVGVDTLVGINTKFSGNIETDGSVRLDGNINGDLKATGDVYVGEQAVVKGNIEASSIYLAGTIEGNIVAKGILKILSTAKLYGDIRVNSFVVDEGALFQGKCDMMEISPMAAPMPEKVADKSKRYKKSNILENIYEEKN